jgi:tetratricopeptide (TPR) repeat protein
VHQSRVWLTVAAAAVLAAVAAGLSTTKATGLSEALGYGAGASVLTFMVGMLTDRGKSLLDRRAAFAAELARGVFQPRNRLPRVWEIADPVTIGVHPAAPLNGSLVPPYVPRDCDGVIRDALRGCGFVMLVGDAAAGKSRTMFEAMRAVLPGHVLIAPDPDRPADAAPAVIQARVERSCVLWLDNLQAFLAGGAITRKDIAEVLAGPGRHRVVLATMGAADEARLTGQLAGGERADPLIQVGQGVIEQVTRRVFLKSRLSAGEKAAVGHLIASDHRIADALRYADRYGIGEYLVSGPKLYSQWEDAWARGQRPRAAALVASAIDCRRAGFTGPLPRALLESLHEEYLEAHGGAVLLPEDLSEAWNWATAQRQSGSSPLRQLAPGYYDVFEYLVDVYRRDHPEPVTDRTVRVALDQASAADVGSIAATAWQERRYELAQVAIERQYSAVSGHVPPDDLELLGIRANLATASLQSSAAGNPFGLPAAEEEYRAIVAAIDARPDADPGFALRARCNLATVLSRQYKLAEAEAQFRAVLDGAVVLPADDAAVLETRRNLAGLLDRTGNLAEAEEELRTVLDAYRRNLGTDHPDTRLIAGELEAVERKRQAAQAELDN